MTGIGRLRRALAAIGLALAGFTTSASATTQARPALWEVADADTRIYLFGTIHMLPKGYRWRTPTVDQALARSDALVVETLIDSQNPGALAAEMARLGMRPGLPPLAARVPPAKHAALYRAIARTGLPIAFLDRLESWAAAMTLISVQFRDLGLSGDAGVEAVLRQAFAAARKPVDQLETNAEQLGFFDRLPEAAQVSLLEGALDAPAATRSQFDVMLRAWASGDTAAIARTFNQEYGDTPQLLDTLLKQRNASWAQWIRSRLAKPGTVMVAVGAGHLAGDASVQAMLEKQGYRVKRLQ